MRRPVKNSVSLHHSANLMNRVNPSDGPQRSDARVSAVCREPNAHNPFLGEPIAHRIGAEMPCQPGPRAPRYWPHVRDEPTGLTNEALGRCQVVRHE